MNCLMNSGMDMMVCMRGGGERGEGRGESEMVLILNDRCGVPLWTVQTR